VDANRSTPEELNSRCGTNGYMALELYNKDVQITDPRPQDVYALGVALKTALTDFDPVFVRHDYSLHVTAMKEINRRTGMSAVHLIDGMTARSPLRRWNIAQVLSHAWFDDVRQAIDDGIQRLTGVRPTVVDVIPTQPQAAASSMELLKSSDTQGTGPRSQQAMSISIIPVTVLSDKDCQEATCTIL